MKIDSTFDGALAHFLNHSLQELPKPDIDSGNRITGKPTL
jgi:hypothetical protein